MKKRMFAAVLWFYAGWYGGALLAELIGLSAVLGPIVGAAAAFVFAGDPRGIIWTRPMAVAESTPSREQLLHLA
jgi:hypothetical protein